MARKKYISQRKLSELIEIAGGTFGLEKLNQIMSPYAGFRGYKYIVFRKALWAALHNALNVGHPKGPRKLHKWTLQ